VRTVSIRLTFWGVRGSIPVPGPTTVKYGGNTSCLELRFGTEDRLIIIDLGSGIRELAGLVMKKDLPRGPIKTKVFLTHTHYDHIMGFPFFTPIFIPGTELDIYGPVTYEEDTLDKIVGDQLRYRYFPVRLEELRAKIDYHQLKEGSIDLGSGLTVTTKYLNHPILVLGYKFEFQGKVLCTAYDHELFRNVFDVKPDDPGYDETAVKEGEIAAREENEKVQAFYRNADLLVHDTQYTHKEYESGKIGWGHSSFEWAINSAHRAGVKHLVLFHHEPLRSDQELEGYYAAYMKLIKGKTRMKVSIAQEGRTFEV
jgi:phosphoribosyl 1,2-cyclic phosphodiesterase